LETVLMSGEHFRSIRLSLPPEQLPRLPRNAAYLYEVIDREVWLTPKPRWYHTLLDLESFPPSSGVELPKGVHVRTLQPDDWRDFPSVFSSAFREVQPFASLDDDERLAAARQSLEQTRTGGDGPLIDAACHTTRSAGGSPRRSC
jgi:hypothetical protein